MKKENKTRTVWLMNSSGKVVEVVEGFESEAKAKAFGKKAVRERNDVFEFKTGRAY